MGLIDDFANAVSHYPNGNVTLTVVAPEVVTGAGVPTEVNVGEVWRFKVRVANNGFLNMTGVMLHVAGQSGATVSPTGATGTFGASFNGGSLTVNGHGSQESGYFYFKAPASPTGTVVDLVRANIQAFDANLNHILTDRTGSSDPPATTFSKKVNP